MFGCLALLLLALVVLPVFGGWVDQDSGYDWDINTSSHWKREKSNDFKNLRANWTQTVSNFSLWTFHCVTPIVWGKGSWALNEDMEYAIRYRLVGNDTDILLKIWFRHSREFFSSYERWEATILLKHDDSCYWYSITQEGSRFCAWSVERAGVQAWFYRNETATDKLFVDVRIFSRRGNLLYGDDLRVTVGEEWFESVTLMKEVHCWGKGECDSYIVPMSEEVKSDTLEGGCDAEPPSFGQSFWAGVSEFLTGIWEGMGKFLPSWITDFVNSIKGFVDWLWSMVNVAWQYVLMFLPFAPLMFMFYFVGAGVRSVHEGSFEPLMDSVLRVWDIGQAVVSALATVVNTIWDFVHIW